MAAVQLESNLIVSRTSVVELAGAKYSHCQCNIGPSGGKIMISRSRRARFFAVENELLKLFVVQK